MYRTAALVSAGLLLAALGDWPYGFYTFLRIAVCLTAVFGVVQSISEESQWWIVLLGIAILFNPVIPIYLDQSTWAPIDVISAGVMAISGFAIDQDGDGTASSQRTEPYDPSNLFPSGRTLFPSRNTGKLRNPTSLSEGTV